MNECLILFLKYPIKGHVKTRLAIDLKEKTVIDLYKCFVFDILTEINKSKINLFIFYSPRVELDLYKKWLGKSFNYSVQIGNTLGEKLANAFEHVINLGYTKIIAIGSDIPGINCDLLKKSFSSLNSFDGVIGPCFDGGYYLIGVNYLKYDNTLFQDISWSTDLVFNQTMKKTKKKSLKFNILNTLIDIDTKEDLKEFFNTIKNKKNLSSKTRDYIIKKKFEV